MVALARAVVGPPWTCRVRAVVRVGLVRRRPGVVAVAGYARTPVGPYREAFTAQLRLPLALVVPWMVVDSAASARSGRAGWGLPKRRRRVAVVLDAVAAAPAVPVAVGGWLRQPGRGRARVWFVGSARAALVRLGGTVPDGVRPGLGAGAVLEGVLRIGPPRGAAAGYRADR